ncbi:MAG: hypothetical protein HY901_35420 [Deltaproteobacteria bacterium]|nr:hypothetical protein [Deltaproteobacteria bacterium]
MPLNCPQFRLRWGRWRLILAICAGLAVPCVLGAIALPNFMTDGLRAKSAEARFNLQGIRSFELSWFDEHGTLLPAGPVPGAVPSGTRLGEPAQKVEFVPDPGFQALEWKPEGRVFFQYRVTLTGPRTAVATARGDIDGDGRLAEYRLVISPDDRRTVVENLTPDHY